MVLVLKVDVICASKLGMTVSGCIYVKAWDDGKWLYLHEGLG
jgi:hypothetical protein